MKFHREIAVVVVKWILKRGKREGDYEGLVINFSNFAGRKIFILYTSMCKIKTCIKYNSLTGKHNLSLCLFKKYFFLKKHIVAVFAIHWNESANINTDIRLRFSYRFTFKVYLQSITMRHCHLSSTDSSSAFVDSFKDFSLPERCPRSSNSKTCWQCKRRKISLYLPICLYVFYSIFWSSPLIFVL